MDFSIFPTAEMVRAEAQRRIEADWPLWRQLNTIREGGEALAAMEAAIDAIRAASNRLEARKKIPADFRDNSHWSIR